MSKVLIVDDHAVNREFLAVVLRHGDFEVVEATDGWSALEAARAERPDLVISDILMPSGDGYELVQGLRREPGLRDVPVIFYTAHFNEREATSLARACGVRAVLTKPADPQDVLRVVRGALGGQASTPDMSGAADANYTRLVSDKLARTADELEWTTSRLLALIEMCLEITSEREPDQLVKTFCRWTRDLVAARHAVVGLWEPGMPANGHIAVSGLSDEAAAAVEAGLSGSMPHPVPLAATAPLRRFGPVSDADNMGLPWAYPPVGAMLVVPVKSPTRQYGWVCATSRISGDAFSADDERLLTIFASYLARIFENHCLLSELSERSRQLELEAARRSASQWRAEIQAAVAVALSRSPDVAEAAVQALKAMCSRGGFALGEVWEVSRDGEHLEHVATWHDGRPGAEDFVAETRRMTFHRGIGLPGRVWRAEVPVWIAELDTDSSFLRKAGAQAAGLTSVVAFPVQARGRVCGVLCLFGDLVRPPDNDLISLFSAVGAQIGQLLERRRQEELLAELQRMRTLQVQMAGLAGAVESRAALYERACRILVEVGGFAYAQVQAMEPGGALVPVAAMAGTEAPAERPGDLDALAAEAFGTGDVAVDNARGFARFGDGACAAVPVLLGGRVTAVLMLHARRPGTFMADELAMARHFAFCLAQALDAMARTASRG